MPTRLSEKAVENSTFGIRVSFNEKIQGVKYPFTPNTPIYWKLSDEHGAVFNEKTQVEIPSAQSIDIVLKDGDLALTGGPVSRYVTVWGTYDGILGDNLPLVDEVSFQIVNLKGKP